MLEENGGLGIFTSFMIINDFVKFEPHRTDFVYLISILNVVADLVIEDAGRLNDAEVEDTIKHKEWLQEIGEACRGSAMLILSPIICESRRM